MTEPVTIAKIAFLTSPDAGKFVLNIGLDDGTCIRYSISWDMLRNIAINGTRMALEKGRP